MKSLWRLVGPMRPNFLTLTPVCVLLGLAAAEYHTGTIPIADAVLVFVGALLAHASVNLLNEYEDFSSGLDAMTVRTPFSGGSGTLQAYPELANAAKVAGYLTLVATAGIGLYFLGSRGLGLLPIGILGLAVVAAYSTWVTRHPLVCLVAPGLGFGPLMVMGTEFALSGQYSMTGALVSLVPFFLVSDLLLINQFPDKEPDQKVGRRHLPIVIGRQSSAAVYAALLVAAFAPIVVGLAAGLLPALAGLGLLPLLVVVPLIRGVLRHAKDIDRLVPYLGINVAVVLATPTLVAVGLLLS